MMAGMPVDRRYTYDHTFFVEGVPVLQGLAFPLRQLAFHGGTIHRKELGDSLGAPGRRTDTRSISYPLR